MSSSDPVRTLRGEADRCRWPRREFWQPRRLLSRDVRRMISGLDPRREDAEITHLSLEVLTPPLLAHIGYAGAGARTVAVPRVADRVIRGGTGDQVVRPGVRDADTLSFFSALMRRGHRSAAGAEACDRIRRIHASVKGVLNEDQIYTLCTLIFLGERYAAAMGHSFYSDLENEARLSFWLGVGRAMGLRGVPETRAELAGWMADYERRHFEPSPQGHKAADAHIRGIEVGLPRPLRPLARSAVIATMDDAVRNCLDYEPISPALLAAMRVGWRSIAATTPIRPVRLDSTWAKSLGRGGPEPDLDRIGYGTYGELEPEEAIRA